MEPMEDYVEKFNEAVKTLHKIAPTIDSVDSLESEEDELKFIKSFRELMRLKTVLTTFTDFTFDELVMSEQDFEDYKSKYLDLYDKVKSSSSKEKVSILDDVDFELELIHRDEINVYYILRLLANYKGAGKEEKERIKKTIANLLASELELRSKRELIEEFINKNLPVIQNAEDIPNEFEEFWSVKQKEAFEKLCQDEKIPPEKVSEIIENYIFNQRTPLPDTIVKLLETKPKLLERKPIVERITNKILDFVDTFINGMV